MDEKNPSRTSGQGREPPRPAPRRRRRRKKRLTVLGVLLYIVFIIGVSALLAALGWVWANDVLALNKPAHTAVVTLEDSMFLSEQVKEEDENGKTTTKTVTRADIDQVAELLREEGIIEYKLLFKVFAKFSHASEKVAPGTYELNTDLDYRAIVASMAARSASRVEVRVTIPEGYTLAQTFQLLEDKGVSTVEKLTEQAATYDYNFPFLKQLPLGDARRLEGYLFPDTYDFYLGEEPKTVLNKMLVNFDRRLDDELRDEIEAGAYSLHDIVIIASLIEKETDGTDQNHIASVIYNRLEHPTKETAGYLNIDASIYYVTGRTVTRDDYQSVDDPYNTYLYKGLPPGPIANPGMAAIRAAIYPSSTKDYWYMLGADGMHHFFSNYDSFIKYQNSLGS